MLFMAITHAKRFGIFYTVVNYFWIDLRVFL